MSKNRVSGIIGIVVGGVWLAHNAQFFERQGFVAIGMPLIVFCAGVIYFLRGNEAA